MRWTHNICKDCWSKENPYRKAVSLSDGEWEACCFCGKGNHDGIFIRHDPKELKCKGKHD
jgi:hypothetical protein